jgi:hypothetical protein
MKKACSVLLSVLLIFTMQLCVFAEAGEIGKTQLKTVVPSTHEITVTYNDGGYVLKDGNLIASGAKFAVDRFDSLSLGAVAKLDSHLERVTVNGKDYTDKLQYGMLRFDSVATDMNIVFTFKKCFGPTEPTTNPTEPTEPTRPTEPTAPTDPSGTTNPGGDHEDPCVRMGMKGNVYRGKNLFPGAKLDIDLGEIKAEAGKDGAYSVDVIKDGFHVVTITDENGEVAGKTTFSVSVSDTATETTVIKLDDGSQIAVVPKGTNTLWLDFVVNDDGTITIVPGTPVEEPTSEVPVTKPSDSGNPIMNNPVISKTGELIRENPLAAAAVFLCGLSLIFFIILRKKRKDDEEEENTKPVC